MKRFLFSSTAVICLFASVQIGHAQYVLDGAYVPQTNLEKIVIDYPHLREADVMYKRRVWQQIDLKQKFNHPFYFPIEEIRDRECLFNVIRGGLLDPETSGLFWAFDPGADFADDEFTKRLTLPEIEGILSSADTIPLYNDYGDVIGDSIVQNIIGAESIVAYQLKEDWIWDKQRSERYVRIIGLAPMVEMIDQTGSSLGLKPLFWLYYPQWRHLFAKREVYNMFNDAQRRTFYDLFEKRYFSSYIVKEDNAFDRTIKSYARGIDALAESERIQQELFNLEHDIWHY